MSEYDTAEVEGIDTELDARDARALTECMTVLPTAGNVYSVTTESGAEYRVDARDGRCTCPDHQYRGVRCKHIRRVAYATGERPVPAFVDTDAVDAHLGEHTDATPRVAATDGGSPADEVLPDSWFSFDETDEDGRPDGCDCGAWNHDERVDLPCWPCYRDGFDVPNPCAGED